MSCGHGLRTMIGPKKSMKIKQALAAMTVTRAIERATTADHVTIRCRDVCAVVAATPTESTPGNPLVTTNARSKEPTA